VKRLSRDGNLGCGMIFGKDSQGGGARCDIDHHSWAPPPKPKSCDVDYGGGLNVGPHRKAEFVCAGDTTLHQGQSSELSPHLARLF
jgi:hypothetical protein